MLDVFKTDAFSLVSLTAAVQQLPYKPGRLGEMGLFADKGIITVNAAVEQIDGVLTLIPEAARGTMPNVLQSRTREARIFRVPHFPLNTSVMADEVQGVREFGSEDATKSVTKTVNDKLETLRQSHEYTHEWMRVGAVKGVILDADGTTEIYDLFDEFGLTQSEINFDLADTDFDVKTHCTELKRTMEDALGAALFDHIHVFCGDTFWDNLVVHPDLETAFERYTNGAYYHEDKRAGLEFPRGVIWENYRGQVGSTKFFDDEEAYAVPIGVPDLFQHVMAPANFIETVNTIGQKIYSKQRVLDFDVGIELHTQSNALMMCNRPGALIKLTMDSESA